MAHSSLLVYGTQLTSAVVGTAKQLLVNTSGASSAGYDNKLGTATGYSELVPAGTTSNWQALSSLPSTASGNGFILDSTLLEGQTMPAGPWTDTIRAGIRNGSATSATVSFYTKVYKRSSGGTYTLIGTITLLEQTVPNSSSNTYNATSDLPSISFTTGDKLYIERWANVTGGVPGTGATLKVDTSSSTTQGSVNCQFTTTGYDVTGGASTHTHDIAGISASVGSISVELGISPGGLFTRTPAQIQDWINRFIALGVTWMRWDFLWFDIEQSQGSFYWDSADALVQYANAAGMRILAILDAPPTWALPPGQTDNFWGIPNNNSQYATFCSAVVNRYKTSIHHWEIWNEPNYIRFTVENYTDLLKQASTAIKAADPTATVLLGGMATPGTGGGSYSPTDWLTGIYANGGGPYFDIANHHPYFWDYAHSFPPHIQWNMLENTSPSIRSVMAANGDSGKPLWITEFGAPTGGGVNAVTEAQQADLLAEGFSRNDDFPWAGPLFWYTYWDNGTDPANYEDWFGLVRDAGTFKPAYTTFQQYATGKDWYDITYAYKKVITIPHANVGGSLNFPDFPLWVSLSDADLKTVANGGKVQNGYDFVFTDDTNVTQLDYQIESYDAVNGVLKAWVRLPTLLALSDTVLSLYFGKSGVGTSQEDTLNVWEMNHIGVWHLQESGGTTNADSTTTGATLTKASSGHPAPTASGKLGSAQSFNGTNTDYETSSSTAFNITGDKTVSAWVNATTFANDTGGASRRIVFKNVDGTNVYQLSLADGAEIGYDGFVWVVNDGTGVHYTAGTNGTNGYSTGTWYYLVGTYVASSHTVTLYVNGSVDNTGPPGSWATASAGSLYVGGRSDIAGMFSGIIDEVRVVDRVRSTDWIYTEYANQSNPAAFYSVGATIVSGSSVSEFSAKMGIAYGGLDTADTSWIHQVLDGCKALGATWLRTDFPWNALEPFQGSYNWTSVDELVAYADSIGLSLLPILAYVPGWALPPGKTDYYHDPPNDNSQFASFCSVIVNRYKNSIHHWEIWNEPNQSLRFTFANYTDLLQRAYTAIKTADPTATVFTGGTSSIESGGGEYSCTDWLTGIYAAGAGGYFDGVAHHPYFWDRQSTFPAPTDRGWCQLQDSSPSLRSIMTANGDGAKPLWSNEFGAPTGGGVNAVTEAQQASMLHDAYIFNNGYSWAGPLFWYNYINSDAEDPADYEDWFGLVHADGTYKPAAQTYQQMATVVDTSLTLYGSSVLDSSGLVTTASKMSSTTGGTETSKQTVLTGSGGVYGEVWSQGNAGLTTVASIPSTPTGRGWTYYPGVSGNFTAGHWSSSITAQVAAGGGGGYDVWFTMRFFKVSAGPSYSLLGSIISHNRPFPGNNTKTSIFLASGLMPSVSLMDTEGIYVDLWWHDSDSDANNDNPTIYVSSSGTAGYANDMQVMTSNWISGYTTPTRDISGVSAAFASPPIPRTLLTISAALNASGVTRPLTGISGAIGTSGEGDPTAEVAKRILTNEYTHGWNPRAANKNHDQSYTLNYGALFINWTATVDWNNLTRYNDIYDLNTAQINSSHLLHGLTQIANHDPMTCVYYLAALGLWKQLYPADTTFDNANALGYMSVSNFVDHVSNDFQAETASNVYAGYSEAKGIMYWALLEGYLGLKDSSLLTQTQKDKLRQCALYQAYIYINTYYDSVTGNIVDLDKGTYEPSQNLQMIAAVFDAAARWPSMIVTDMFYDTNHPQQSPDIWKSRATNAINALLSRGAWNNTYHCFVGEVTLNQGSGSDTVKDAVAKMAGFSECLTGLARLYEATTNASYLDRMETLFQTSETYLVDTNLGGYWQSLNTSTGAVDQRYKETRGTAPMLEAYHRYNRYRTNAAYQSRERDILGWLTDPAKFYKYDGGGGYFYRVKPDFSTQVNHYTPNWTSTLTSSVSPGATSIQVANFPTMSSTTSTTSVSSGSRTVTPASMTNITNGDHLLIAAGTSQNENVTVTATTSSTFTATFAKSHSGTWTIDVPYADNAYIINYGQSDIEEVVLRSHLTTGSASPFTMPVNPEFNTNGQMVYSHANGEPIQTYSGSDFNNVEDTFTTEALGHGALYLLIALQGARAVGPTRPISGISAALQSSGGVSTSLTLYGVPLSSTILVTAKQLLSNTSGATSAGYDHTLGTATGYSELLSLGTTNAWQSLSSLPSYASGNGSILDGPLLEGKIFPGGSWADTIRAGIRNGSTTSATVSFYTKVYLYYVQGNSYTLIGTLSLLNQTVPNSSSANFTVTGTLPSFMVPSGYRLYVERWANVTVGVPGTGATFKVDTSASTTAGSVNCQTVTPGYTTTSTFTRGITTISASLNIGGGTRTLSGIFAAINAVGVTRPLTSIGAAIGMGGGTRAISGVTASTKALGLTRSASSISASMNTGGGTRAISGVSATMNTGPTFYASPGDDLSSKVNSLRPGDTLILNNGTYTSSLDISDVHGTSSAWITIAAANDGAAIIDGQGGHLPLNIDGSSYVLVRGLHCRNSYKNTVFVYGSSNHITLQRISAEDAAIGNWHNFAIESGPDTILLEDCASWGRSRYMFSPYQSTNVTFRRCFAYWEGMPDDEGDPRAAINNYASSNSIFENCIGRHCRPSAGVSNEYHCATYQTSDGPACDNAKWLGCLFYDNWEGFWLNDAGGANALWKDCYFQTPLDTSGYIDREQGDGLFFNENNNSHTVQHCTFKGCVVGMNRDGSSGNVTLRNSAFVSNTTGLSSAPSHSYCGFYGNGNNGTSTVSTDVTANPNYNLATYGSIGGALFVPTGSPYKGKGEGGSDIGCNILYRYVNGNLTNEPLWPWPMEARIVAGTGASPTYASGGGPWTTLAGLYGIGTQTRSIGGISASMSGGTARTAGGISASIGIVVGTINLYGSSVLDSSGLVPTASKMSTTTGGSETSKQTVQTGSNTYAEVWSQGNAGGLAGVASLPAPTGHGWMYYPGIAGTFVAGNWSATINAALALGEGETTNHFVLRFYRYRYGIGSYTLIGSINSGGNPIPTRNAKTQVAFAATSMPPVAIAANDGLYIDLWWNDTLGVDADNPTIYESNSGTAGVASDMQILTSVWTLAEPQTTERQISGISTALTVPGIVRSLTDVVAAINIGGGVRKPTGISSALKATMLRALTGTTGAFKAFGISRTASSISVSVGTGPGPFAIYISGGSVPVQQAGISFEQRLDDRAGGSFAVIDEDGATYALQERQQVEILDTEHALTLYRGFIDSSSEIALSPSGASPSVMRTVTLEDLRALAEKRLCTRDYTNWTAGNIAADLVQSRLASEQIVANFAMRHDQDSTGFGQGTLSNVQGTNGYLELARAGTDFTHADTTTADFAEGTLSGVTATNNELRLNSYTALKMTGVAGSSIGFNQGNYYAYWTIWQGSITVNSGDYFEYYLWVPSNSTEMSGGLDWGCSDNYHLKDAYWPDQWGIWSHPASTLQGWADDQWLYRSIGVPPNMVGRTVRNCTISLEGNKEGPYTFYIRAARLRSSNHVIRATFFDTTLQRCAKAGSVGYYNVSVKPVTVYEERGYRIAPAQWIAAAGIAGRTAISWTDTLPTQTESSSSAQVTSETGRKQVKVEASINNGDTWHVCENGKVIPCVLTGQNLTGLSLLVKTTLAIDGPNPEQPPSLQDISTYIEAAYKATKTDVSSSYTGSEMTDGSNSLCGYQAAISTGGGWQRDDVSGLKMDGWRKQWYTGIWDMPNEPFYGSSSPGMGISNGTLYLQSEINNGAHVHLSDAGNYSTLIVEADIQLNTANDAGILYRTTYWGNTDNSWGYYVCITVNSLNFGYGSNSSTNRYTLVSTFALTIDVNTWYHLRVVVGSDNVHHVYLNDVEYMTVSNSVYTGTGGVGLRMWAPGSHAGQAHFDHFGVGTNTSLTQGVRTAPAVSLAGASSVGDSRIWWQEETPTGTSLTVETSTNGGSTYMSCINGSAIPNLTAGQSLSGVSLLVRTTLMSDSISYTPTLLNIAWIVTSAFSASGERVSPALLCDDAATVGSSSVTWDASVPASGTLVVDSSLNGSSWSTISASGDPVTGLTEQGDCWWDTFDTDTSANYSYTAGHWQWDTLNSRLVGSENLAPFMSEYGGGFYGVNEYSSEGSGTLTKNGINPTDVEITLVSDQMDSLQIRLRNGGSGYYALRVTDNDGVGGSQLDFERWTSGGGSVLLHTDHTRNITRGVYHVVRLIVKDAVYSVWLNGTAVYQGTDPSPLLTSGSCGLWFNAGISYVRDLAIRQLGQTATGVNIYTRTRLTSTNPIESPVIKSLVACVRAPEIATGAVVPQTQDWAYKKSVAEALDEIAKSSDMSWRFNESYRLVMRPRDGEFAPFVLWQGDNGTIDGATLPRVQRQSTTYRNRQYITGSKEMVECEESKLGNGYSTSWELTYPVEEVLSITMNGQTQTFGIRDDTDTGKGRSFYYKQGENVLSFDTSLAAPSSVFTVTYIARKPYVAMAEDTNQQTIVAALEGSTGIVEASEEQSGISKDAADTLAQSRLSENARLSISISSLTTRVTGLAPGQLLTVVIPKHGLIDLQMLITGVSTQVRQLPNGSLVYWYTVDVTTGPSLGSWARALSLRMIRKGGG